MKPIEILDMTINNAKAAIRLYEEIIPTLEVGSDEMDIAIQGLRDNKKFIAEQIWTKSLTTDTIESTNNEGTRNA